MKTPAPRSVILDIETSHDILASYGLREQYHSPDNILQDWYIICAKWKWHGGKKQYGACVLDDMKRFRKDCSDDYIVVKALHELLSNVDEVIGHNVKCFDWKMIVTRIIYHRLPPIPQPVFIDTLKEIKKISRHSSASLKHLAKYHGLTNKIEHSRNMGIRILQGDIKETKECYDYCGGDIDTTEELLDLYKPYMINAGINRNSFRADGIECCPSCGGENLTGYKNKRTVNYSYKQYQCKDCGRFCSGTHRMNKVILK